ncbi:MAG: glutamyl-queuosine tRNA(Asp) synthetase [Bryobacterales bacterium]|nr:glutamyl-queuosine tRNA(Asp) synthetase [Bryobacterales bacterium]
MSSPDDGTYRGRFAPSPTGPLHFGSLVTAIASYLDARANGGAWLLRLEDVDLPRCIPGADLDIIGTLSAYGFEWDGPIVYQTARTPAYESAFEALRNAGLAYPCSCSRKDIGDAPYRGVCREGVRDPNRPVAWRVRADAPDDFIIKRSDGFFTYQLAVVVDDAGQRITNVVRGGDLLDSTPRQNWLQRALGYPIPAYLHLPVATNAAGKKLSKQTLAPPLDDPNKEFEISRALRFLGQRPQTSLAAAIPHWNSAVIPAPGCFHYPFER